MSLRNGKNVKNPSLPGRKPLHHFSTNHLDLHGSTEKTAREFLSAGVARRFRQSTSTEREVRSSPQAQSASALGRARKRQGHSCARELVAGSGEPTSTAREARPSPPAPSAAVLGKPLTRAILLNPTDVRWQIWTSLARIAKETLGHRVGLQWSPWIYDSTFDGGMEKLQILDSKHCASHIYH